MDTHTWYSGTPETDRFRANDSGQALWVELAGPGTAPIVTPIATGQYRWQIESMALQVPSDLDAALQWLGELGPEDVVQLEVSGRIDLAGHRRLCAAIERARGAARSLSADLSALRLEPTAEDIDKLHADGYLGEAIAALQAAQAGEDAEVARAALTLLAGLLDSDRDAGAPDAGATP